MVEYGILGPLRVTVAGQVVDLGGPRQRAVLAVLLLDRNRVVSVDQLLDLVWGEDPPPSAQAALHNHISRLRRLLGSAEIETRTPGYALRVDPGNVDVERFQALVGRAQAAAPREASAYLRQALGLWRGPPLADVAYEPFAEVEIAKLEELRLGALEARIEADLASGRHQAITGELEALVAEHPYRERLHAQRILALYRSGRQGEALAAYQGARTALADGLGVDPGADLQALVARVLRQDPTLAPAATREAGSRPTGTLPVVDELIGRTGDLVRVEAALSASRIVTITGLGGSGKTHLAVAVARRLSSDALPARFVDLSVVTGAGDVVGLIAAVLGAGGAAASELELSVATALAWDPCLLVLDNFEHVLEARGIVARILEHAPAAKVLATSRVRLGLPTELEIPLDPLQLPGSVATVETSDASQLFLRRARQHGGLRTLQGVDAEAVVQICGRLDGLPLALELAAAWTRILSPRAIVQRLAEGRLALVAEEDTRHASLDRVVESTLDLVSPPDRAAFEALSLFKGGFDDRAAAAVTGLVDPLPTLRRLESVALLQSDVEPDGGPRFRLLETIRLVALRRLDQRDDAAGIQRRLVAHYATHAQIAAERLRDFNSGSALAWMRLEAGNLHLAFDLACAMREASFAVPLAVMATFGSPVRTSLHRVQTALDLGSTTPAIRSEGLNAVVIHAAQLDEGVDSLALCEEALDLARQAGDRRLEVRALISLGSLGRPSNAEAVLQQAAMMATDIGYDWAAIDATGNLANLVWDAGRVDEALELFQRTAALAAQNRAEDALSVSLANMAQIHANLGQGEVALELATKATTMLGARWPDTSTMAWALAVKAVAESLEGSMSDALGHLAEACRLALVSESEVMIAEVLEGAVTVLARDSPLVASRALGCRDRILTTAGVHRGGRPLVDRRAQEIRGSIGASRFELERRRGADMTAVGCAQEVESVASTGARADRAT